MLEVIKYNEKSGIVVVNLLKSVQIMYLLSTVSTVCDCNLHGQRPTYKLCLRSGGTLML